MPPYKIENCRLMTVTSCMIAFASLCSCGVRPTAPYISDSSSDQIDAGNETEIEESPRGYVSNEDDLKYGESWARAWGGDGWCQSQDVTFGPDGSVYVTGWFSETTDFNPEAGEDFRTSESGESIFLTKFASDGNYNWTLTWEADEVPNIRAKGSEGWAVTVANDNSIYIAGRYGGLLDMDPGPDEWRTHRGGPSPFLIKLNPDGTFAWGVDSQSGGDAMNVSVYEDHVYVTGGFLSGGYNDPNGTLVLGDLSATLEYGGQWDCYAASLNAETGEGNWLRVWGSNYDEYNCRSAIFQEQLVVVGAMDNLMDLDPGPGVYPRERLDDLDDPFLLRFDKYGNLTLAEIWTSDGWDYTDSVATSENTIFIMGELTGTMFFDTISPPSTIERISETSFDSYLMRMEKDGARTWARSWGGASAMTRALDIAVTDTGILVVGKFEGGPVNFGTTEAPEIYNLSERSAGNSFVRAVDFDGNPTWVRIFSGDGYRPWISDEHAKYDHSYAGAVSAHAGFGAIAGAFWGTIDMDMGTGRDLWESPSLYACYVIHFPTEPPPSSSKSGLGI